MAQDRQKFLARQSRNAKKYVARHPLISVWRNMMLRCGHWSGGNKKNVADYAKRGIVVCDEWRKFPPFEEWAIKNGWRKGLVIDRIDNDRGYSPDNCRFVTQAENLLNRRNTIYVTYKGKRVRLYDLWMASEKVVTYKMLSQRVHRRGWDIEKALTTKKLNQLDNLNWRHHEK